MLSFWKSGVSACALLAVLVVASGQTVAVAQKAASSLTVELVGAPVSDAESNDVLSALKKLLSGIEQRNLDQIGECLSPEVTTFDAHSHKFVYGKESVLANIKQNVVGAKDSSPVKRLVVHDPFVRVKGETAMVSFRATKEMADAKSTKLESWCAEVFERKDGQWLVLQLRTDWKPARSME